jgi:hypothetical protein
MTTDFDGIIFSVLLIIFVVNTFKFVETALITVVGAGFNCSVLFAKKTWSTLAAFEATDVTIFGDGVNVKILF